MMVHKDRKVSKVRKVNPELVLALLLLALRATKVIPDPPVLPALTVETGP